MAFDLLVLVLSVAGLMRTGHGRGSGLWKLLFRDGIAYFAVAFVGNFIAFVSASVRLASASHSLARLLFCVLDFRHFASQRGVRLSPRLLQTRTNLCQIV